MAKDETRRKILDSAERRARTGGYGGFSFREIATDVGVKSASVHYHFPTKADLGKAMVDRYVERTEAFLTPAQSAAEALSAVIGLFRQALEQEELMCLCGLFGAERDALPDAVQTSTAGYFRLLIDYLAAAPGKTPAMSPETVVAALEGALIMARALGDNSAFEQVAKDLQKQFA